MLDQPLVSEADIVAMDPNDLAEAVARGLVSPGQVVTKADFGPACEVWLHQENLEIGCMIVREDETTTSLDIDALSLRGAEREITGYLISQGYKPAGRWHDARDLDHGKSENWLDAPAEVMRQFKKV